MTVLSNIFSFQECQKIQNPLQNMNLIVLRTNIQLQLNKPIFQSYFLYYFRIYDIDNDGYISNGELFQVLKMMVGSNLKDTQLQQIVDKTILFADKDGTGKINFEEFCEVVGNTDVHKKMVVDV